MMRFDQQHQPVTPGPAIIHPPMYSVVLGCGHNISVGSLNTNKASSVNCTPVNSPSLYHSIWMMFYPRSYKTAKTWATVL